MATYVVTYYPAAGLPRQEREIEAKNSAEARRHFSACLCVNVKLIAGVPR